jgi:hypothetical protein
MAAESFLMRWQESGHPKRFRFLNAEQFGTIRACSILIALPWERQEIDCNMQSNSR